MHFRLFSHLTDRYIRLALHCTSPLPSLDLTEYTCTARRLHLQPLQHYHTLKYLSNL